MRKELRLWVGENKPWNNKYSKHLFRSYRQFIEIWFDSGWKGFGICFAGERENMDGTYHLMFDNTSIGFQWVFSFGHEVMQYDGFWHRFSFGPFFVTWYE